ncbi:hypothetical protein GDO81_002907 [Engystomops pustulosus]|uniref:Uncharacterized protein n=1 Tax=Engystomops pustulosus TaxID=76066 RepID=A0AAV7DRD3_ENGPU|nr:hypothetical protein GDO81_002907 [Engystomops pustulosus]
MCHKHRVVPPLRNTVTQRNKEAQLKTGTKNFKIEHRSWHLVIPSLCVPLNLCHEGLGIDAFLCSAGLLIFISSIIDICNGEKL